VRRARTALLVPVLALALSGCLSQPEEANDNGPQEQPTRPPDVVREPEVVESPGLTADQPDGPKTNPSPS
jgi:starvation-inducible outer membrane lipoprotein